MAMATRERASAAFLRPAAVCRLPFGAASVDHSMRSSVHTSDTAVFSASMIANAAEKGDYVRRRPRNGDAYRGTVDTMHLSGDTSRK